MAADTAIRRAGRGVRSAFDELLEAFDEHQLLTFASATAFQILTAIVPFVLFALALLGFLDLASVWRNDISKDVSSSLSPAAFSVINDTVVQILTTKQVFWMTFGFALALWQVSGAVRAVMDGLDVINGSEDGDRSTWRRYGRSLLLALAVGACLFLAVTAVVSGRFVLGRLGLPGALVFLIRWALAAVLLAVAVGFLFRYAPAQRRPVRWASRGSLLVVGAWVGASVLFALYLTQIASYTSVFGVFASIVILLGYLYLSTAVFFAGAELEARFQDRDGEPLKAARMR